MNEAGVPVASFQPWRARAWRSPLAVGGLFLTIEGHCRALAQNPPRDRAANSRAENQHQPAVRRPGVLLATVARRDGRYGGVHAHSKPGRHRALLFCALPLAAAALAAADKRLVATNAGKPIAAWIVVVGGVVVGLAFAVFLHLHGGRRVFLSIYMGLLAASAASMLASGVPILLRSRAAERASTPGSSAAPIPPRRKASRPLPPAADAESGGKERVGSARMSDGQVFPVPAAWAKRAHMDAAGYDAAWERVEADPEGYWSDIAARLDWMTPFSVVKDVSYDRADFRIRWFADGVLNASVDFTLDLRHLPTSYDIAIIWEGDMTPDQPARSPTPRPTPRPAAWPIC